MNNEKISYRSRYLTAIFIFIGISGCFSVLFGAWFAHAGVNLSDDVHSRLTNALQYQFFHTLALLAIAVWLQTLPEKNEPTKLTKTLYLSTALFIVGILCFSGCLYIKTFFDLAVIGKLAPFGGLSFALGWLLISWAGINKSVPNLGVGKDRL